jgi:hypothetical protein
MVHPGVKADVEAFPDLVDGDPDFGQTHVGSETWVETEGARPAVRDTAAISEQEKKR